MHDNLTDNLKEFFGGILFGAVAFGIPIIAYIYKTGGLY
jgi:hypothetical protein